MKINRTKGKQVLFSTGLVLLGLACLFFTVYPLVVKPEEGWFGVLKQYSYFTDQVVVLCGIYFILVGLTGLGVKGLYGFVFHPYVKAGIMVYIAVVGITYYVGVVPFSILGADGLFVGELQSVFMHALVPVAMGAVYFGTPFTQRISLARSLYLLVYPVAYLAYLIIFTRITGIGIYPFLRMEYVGSYGNMLLCFAGIVLGTLAIGYLIIRLYNRSYARGERRSSQEKSQDL